MENWLLHKPTLYSFAKHYQTGEPLPDDIFDKLKRAKTFQTGMMMARQLSFGALDVELHARYDGSEDPFDAQARIFKTYAPMPPLPEDAFLSAFSHIFAGGYSCGYYSYKWAEVMSADAFAAFVSFRSLPGLTDPPSAGGGWLGQRRCRPQGRPPLPRYRACLRRLRTSLCRLRKIPRPPADRRRLAPALRPHRGLSDAFSTVLLEIWAASNMCATLPYIRTLVAAPSRCARFFFFPVGF